MAKLSNKELLDKFFSDAEELFFPRIREVDVMGLLTWKKVRTKMGKVPTPKHRGSYVTHLITSNPPSIFNKSQKNRSVITMGERKVKNNNLKLTLLLMNPRAFNNNIEEKRMLSVRSKFLKSGERQLVSPTKAVTLREMTVELFLEDKKPIGNNNYSALFNNFFTNQWGTVFSDEIYADYYQLYGKKMDTWWKNDLRIASSKWIKKIRSSILKLHEGK